MKTLIVVASVAVLAIVLVEISQTAAQRGGNRRCPDNRRPPINTTEPAKCDPPQRRPFQGFRLLACLRQCRECYQREELNRPPVCLVEGKCQCLGRNNSTGTTEEPGEGETTTEGPGNGEGSTTEEQGSGSTTEGQGGVTGSESSGTDQPGTTASGGDSTAQTGSDQPIDATTPPSETG